MVKLEWLATLQPNFAHFPDFVADRLLSGIRLNNPEWTAETLALELENANSYRDRRPLYFDVKGWQLRVTEAHPNPEYLDISINHPIEVDTPTMVVFKAGADSARLLRIEEGGTRLIFEGGPQYKVKPGESLQIRHPSLRVLGEQFLPAERAKIEVARKAGIDRYFLSYVESEEDVARFRELVGPHALIMLKIENLRGMQYVAKKFKKRENVRLVAARGDLYVEVPKPHDILGALQLIIQKDPDACAGSRIMLSVIHSPVPSCADWLELAWMVEAGYRSMMLCDELCLKGDLLQVALNACEAFSTHYNPLPPQIIERRTSWFDRFRKPAAV